MKKSPIQLIIKFKSHGLTSKDRFICLLLLASMAVIAVNIYCNEKDQKKTGASTPVIEHNINL